MSSQKWKSIVWQFSIGLLTFVLLVTGLLAQDSTTRALTPDAPITGTLDAGNPVEVYTLTGRANDSYALSVVAADDAAVYLHVTDATGASISASGGGDGSALTGTSSITVTFTLPADGTYYVTVVSLNGVGDTAIDFELNLALQNSAAVFTPPGELLTATGLQVRLTWDSQANMDLEVRDPVGGSLYFDTPTVASGGQFGVNANSVCANRVAENAIEQVTWPAGVVPTGSYELLVYYQPLQDCPTTDSVTFTIEATVDGQAVPAFEGTLSPNQVFLASFVVNADGTSAPGLSGVKVDPPAAPSIQGATPTGLTLGSPVAGVITSQQPFAIYTFVGQPGDIVSVDMAATSGNLDTLLMLLDPNGNQIATNDDRDLGITNSLILNAALVLDGTYTVIATRYGQNLGGTQGDYTIALTGPITADLSGTQTAVLPDLPNLPNGAVEVSLQWNTAADLQLLVRDPQGNAVFDDRPSIASTGATLAANGNVNCIPADGSPVSYIYWPEGRLPAAGPYEIEVQYQNQCNDTNPVQFTLNVVVNGQLVLTANQQPRPGERFVTSFNIGVDGLVTAGDGGFFGTVQRPDYASLDYLAEIENAQVMTSGQTLTGSIRLNQKFQVYVFNGEAGQRATVGMEALNGTLDPVVFLLDQNGVQVAQNDDAAGGGTTNSLISEFILPEDGQYIIIATHFGARYGVTSGDYNLTLRLN